MSESHRRAARPKAASVPVVLCALALVDCVPAPSGPAAASISTSASVSGHAGPSGKPRLRRGMNLGNALDAPNEGAWGVVLGASDFVAARQAGFDHVRLPVRFSAHAASSP